MQSSPSFFFFLSSFIHARFQHENVKLFGNLLPCRAFTERSHIKLSSARMFDAASLVEHMPHSVSGRLCLYGCLFFYRAVTLAIGRKGWSGTAAVQPSVSIMTCMTWPKNTRSAKKYQQCSSARTTVFCLMLLYVHFRSVSQKTSIL